MSTGALSPARSSTGSWTLCSGSRRDDRSTLFLTHFISHRYYKCQHLGAAFLDVSLVGLRITKSEVSEARVTISKSQRLKPNCGDVTHSRTPCKAPAYLVYPGKIAPLRRHTIPRSPSGWRPEEARDRCIVISAEGCGGSPTLPTRAPIPERRGSHDSCATCLGGDVVECYFERHTRRHVDWTVMFSGSRPECVSSCISLFCYDKSDLF